MPAPLRQRRDYYNSDKKNGCLGRGVLCFCFWYTVNENAEKGDYGEFMILDFE